MFKINKKTLERRQWRRSGVFIINFARILQLALKILLLTQQVNGGCVPCTHVCQTSCNYIPSNYSCKETFIGIRRTRCTTYTNSQDRSSQNFAKFTGKHLRQSLFLNKAAGLRPATLFKERLRHRCFPVNFAKVLRTLIFIEHLRWLLLIRLQQAFVKRRGSSKKIKIHL